ncbi:MAG: AAA family ATPase [Treponema sp.]|nr:AAA family ATPase [Treponema sp.]
MESKKTSDRHTDRRKDLFEDLAIAKSETEWKQYPVFYFDFNAGAFSTESEFRNSLGLKLDAYEKIYGVRNENAKSPADRLRCLLQQAHRHF